MTPSISTIAEVVAVQTGKPLKMSIRLEAAICLLVVTLFVFCLALWLQDIQNMTDIYPCRIC
jgi:hypothetical protein